MTTSDARELVARMRRRTEWLMILTGIAIGVIGPITLALFVRLAWTDWVSRNFWGLAFCAHAALVVAFVTWRGTRYAHKLRELSSLFDAGITQAYERGASDMKRALRADMHGLGQAIANATGKAVNIVLDDEHVVCHPETTAHRH